jgi:hypothetical protein
MAERKIRDAKRAFVNGAGVLAQQKRAVVLRGGAKLDSFRETVGQRVDRRRRQRRRTGLLANGRNRRQE